MFSELADSTDMQEHYRFWMSSDLDDRTLHELYWAPYLRAIEVGHAVRSINASQLY